MAMIRAAVGSLVFLAVAPGVVAGVIPWALTGWSADDWSLPVRLVGGVVIVVGLAGLLPAFVRFVVEGLGTPAPVAPTERLVVGGAYRHVRNPMYLAVGAVIVGQGLLLGQAVLLLYAVIFAAAVTSLCVATRSQHSHAASARPTDARSRAGARGCDLGNKACSGRWKLPHRPQAW